MAREYWKFLPMLLFAAAVALIMSLGLDSIMSQIWAAITSMDPRKLPAILAIIPAFYIFMLIWFVGPFLYWRGQSWHDALAATKIVIREKR